MKTWKIVLTTFLSVISFAAVAVLFKRIKTMLSIRHVGGKLYKVDYYADYKLDKLLVKGVKDVSGLMSFLSQEIYFGYPINVNEHLSGCTSFAALSPTGKLLAGRNFDYPKTDMLLVHTRPKNGYASYSMVCLAHLNISEEAGTMPETLMGKFMILSAPYACVDGINEKGLHVAVLELSTKPTAQDTGRTKIITTVAVRMLLDKCASTEEAVAELSKYDMFSSAGAPYHFLITDAQGDTIIVEWPDPEQAMVVLKQSYATNFQLAGGKNKDVGLGHDRYKIVAKNLEQSQGVVSEDEAMRLLEAVSIKGNSNFGTQWSIVYNVSNVSLKICCDMDYSKVYEFRNWRKHE